MNGGLKSKAIAGRCLCRGGGEIGRGEGQIGVAALVVERRGVWRKEAEDAGFGALG